MAAKAALSLFGQHLMKVGNHGNRHIHKSQLKTLAPLKWSSVKRLFSTALYSAETLTACE